MRYARRGYAFYSISTPGVFREYELPEYEDNETTEDREKMAELMRLEDRYGAPIERHIYARGG